MAYIKMTIVGSQHKRGIAELILNINVSKSIFRNQKLTNIEKTVS